MTWFFPCRPRASYPFHSLLVSFFIIEREGAKTTGVKVRRSLLHKRPSFCLPLVLVFLTVAAHLHAEMQAADAELPAGMALNWDKKDVVAVNSKRAQMALDGIWQFIPAPEGTSEPPKVGWAYIKVPGSWQGSRGRASDIVGLGRGPQWDRYDGARVGRAWYQRQVAIPAEWQGRAISLRFDRVC